MKMPKLAAAGALAILASAACAPGRIPDPSPAGWPEDYRDFTIVWTGEQGIDLVNGSAVVVRAYLESVQLVEMTGDQKYAYPGFADAVDEELRPANSEPEDRPWVGTQRNHILSVTRSGDTITADGCMYTYRVASLDSNGRYEPRAYPTKEPDGGMSAFRVTLRAPSDSANGHQSEVGPARTPFDDVFGQYRVTAYWGGYFRSRAGSGDGQVLQHITDACVAAAPDPFEQRLRLISSFPPRAELPTLPPYPGWPAKPTK
ncbi:hypothetical protein [Mycolicibacterium brisbanense]|uniref:hypothetical protein n=1 Tax=Mycolicibacterium brisbanense TaxID=146020 RepID=UPI00104236B3|nr:hypothetical protein [Mycolicibacterium brisbanense]MCV7160536.1 hypothetical protein [Mycolicibacterium brisbanense]